MILADRSIMQPDRTANATVGDLLDLEERIDKRFERIERSMAMEMGRIANVMMEHMTSLMRAAGDHSRAIEERLDAHVADQTVHVRPRVSAGRRGARRARGGGPPRR